MFHHGKSTQDYTHHRLTVSFSKMSNVTVSPALTFVYMSSTPNNKLVRAPCTKQINKLFFFSVIHLKSYLQNFSFHLRQRLNKNTPNQTMGD